MSLGHYTPLIYSSLLNLSKDSVIAERVKVNSQKCHSYTLLEPELMKLRECPI